MEEVRRTREEQDVFNDLEKICRQPGFCHAIAMLCFRDNIVGVADELKGEDYARLFSSSRLIRTELSTLIGLMARGPIDWQKPTNDNLAEMMERAETLLAELHAVLNAPGEDEFRAAVKILSEGGEANPFEAGSVLREPMFYAAESAYPSQYRDFAKRKYDADNDWLKGNRGFSIEDAAAILTAILSVIEGRLLETIRNCKDKDPEEWSLLPGFEFEVDDIVAKTGFDPRIIKSFLDAFCLRDQNPTFGSLNAFNATNACPILEVGEGRYVLFQYVSLAEAIYESPFFWMLADEKYRSTATTNRGKFVEAFAAERFQRVFGKSRVFTNVDVWKSKSEKIGEIDVLIVFADRIVLVQCKAKRLTLAARHGSDVHLHDDFKAAVQDANDQAYICAEALLNPAYRLVDGQGQEIKLTRPIADIFPLCIVSDHYPALSFQARQFLRSKTTDIIRTPLVSDLFMLDVMTEFLDGPLRCLSYLSFRALAGENVLSSHEITTLGYHLKRNLWLGQYSFIQMHDDISADVDVAMAVRRDGMPGNPTPPGILTVLNGTSLGGLVDELEARATPWATSAGLEILKIDGGTIDDLCAVIDRLAEQGALGKEGSSTLLFSEQHSGLTIQCNERQVLDGAILLKEHCAKRKYLHRASSWVGLLIQPGSASLRHCVVLEGPWKEDNQLAKAAAQLEAAQPPHKKATKGSLEKYKRRRQKA